MKSPPIHRRNKATSGAMRLVRLILAGLLIWLMALGVVPNRTVYAALANVDAASQLEDTSSQDSSADSAEEEDNESPSESGDDPDPSGDDDDDNVEMDELCDRDLPMVAPRISRSAWVVFESDSAQQAILRAPEKFPSAG